MADEKKTHKRKVLMRYLILAACILVVAAITVTVVFAANDWFRQDITIEKPNDDNNDDNKDNPPAIDNPDDNKGNDNQGNDDNQGNKPTTTVNTFLAPIRDVNVSNVYDFGKDVTLGHYHFHEGLDLAAAVGTEVVACLDGVVESIVYKDYLDGNSVTIKHDNGLKTVYTYVEVADGLKNGAKVTRGQKIGTVAEPVGAEYLQEAHVHFEVIENGEKTDPEKFLQGGDK